MSSSRSGLVTDLASVGEDAREASYDLALLSTAAKDAILVAMADGLGDRAPEILEANAKDVDAAVVASNLAFNGWRLTAPRSGSIYSLSTARKRNIGGFPTVLKASRLRL